MNSIDGEHLLLSKTEQLLLRGFVPSGRPITRGPRLRLAVKLRARCCAVELAVIHGSQRFDRHLHNGDRLSARTAQVPSGRPKGGNPPFTMRGKCTDALPPASEIDKLLFRLGWYDGHGYRSLSIRFPSPYLWSFSNHCSRTNFVDNGKYSAQAVSAQCGAGVLLRRFAETGMTLFVRPGEQALSTQSAPVPQF
jgi:hypothetical protein